jgi:RNA 3'-terminal phosphate cyclase (ATP)
MSVRQDILSIDGAQGEGGGQILRTALALSICRRRPFRLFNIRARRNRPGLQPQHLVAVKAAASICRASVEGMSLGSQHLLFEPYKVIPGDYEFDIGTAGSTGLVLQTLLPPLLGAEHPSRITLHGGTHNPLAPCYEFLAASFVPMLQEMGADVRLHLIRSGYYPNGGGEIVAEINPIKNLKHVVLINRGALGSQQALATVAHLPRHIAERELAVVGERLGIPLARLHIHVDNESHGPGNVLNVCMQYDKVTAVFTGFGQRGVPAEEVASNVVRQVEDYLNSGVPVERYLADQLLIYLALAGGGKFLTQRPTQHTLTNISIIELFTPCRFRCVEVKADEHYISVQ